MLILREREKLLEAIKYFASHTKYCGLTKLFKLLFFLDFAHFRETGRSVTGLDYQAWQMGPVAPSLYAELRGEKGPDMKAHLQITDPAELTQEIRRDDLTNDLREDAVFFRYSITDSAREAYSARVPAKIKALRQFNPKLFTKRELRLMEEIAFMYKELRAEQMSEVSHLKGKPWHVTKTKHGLKAPIDYMLALDEAREGAPSKEEILARIEERKDVLDTLK